MLTKSQIICCAACLFAVAGSSWAAEINKREGPDPGQQTKINRVMARAYSIPGQLQDCGTGNMNDPRRPGEVATFVDTKRCKKPVESAPPLK